MMGFTFVPTGNFDKPIQTGHCICNTCGARIETGIINLSEHWSQCAGKEDWKMVQEDSKKYIETIKQRHDL